MATTKKKPSSKRRVAGGVLTVTKVLDRDDMVGTLQRAESELEDTAGLIVIQLRRDGEGIDIHHSHLTRIQMRGMIDKCYEMIRESW